MKVKVSVIVPMYNVENYIDKCIQGIINQTFKDIEIILVKVHSKLILSILQDIISFDFQNNKRKYFKVSRSLGKHYIDDIRSKDITYKNKIHISLIKISASLYKYNLNLIK